VQSIIPFVFLFVCIVRRRSHSWASKACWEFGFLMGDFAKDSTDGHWPNRGGTLCSLGS
jgi:hypothetical protein